MSKKFEVTSCFNCPNYSQYDHDGTVYDTAMAQCSAYADGDTVVARVFEDVQLPGFIWSECPLEAYNVAPSVSKAIMNRHAIRNSFGIPKTTAQQLWEETVQEMATPETVTLAPVEMQELMVIIDESYSTSTYYAPDGNSYNDHPSKTNEFIQRVRQSGGNIVSINMLGEQIKFIVHYSVPTGTYPISV